MVQVVNQTESDIEVDSEVIPRSSSTTIHISYLQGENLEKLEDKFDIEIRTKDLIIIKDLIPPSKDKIYVYPKDLYSLSDDAMDDIDLLEDKGLILGEQEFKKRFPELNIDDYRYEVK